MNYCSQCGAEVHVRVPEQDNFPRHVCTACGEIHYQNPKVVVGVLPRWKGRILLCRRAIEPRHGYWTLPAGFMENGETLEEGALRELHEEARARAEISRLFSIFSLTHVNQVYLMFLADLVSPEFGAGEESLEVELFPVERIPWDELAFRAVEFTLRCYTKQADPNEATVHRGEFRKGPGGGGS